MSYQVQVTRNPSAPDGSAHGYTAALYDGEQPLCAASGRSRSLAVTALHGAMQKMHGAHHATVLAALEVSLDADVFSK